LFFREGYFYEKFKSIAFTGNVKGRKRGFMKSGQLDGEWKEYYKNGKLKSNVNFSNIK